MKHKGNWLQGFGAWVRGAILSVIAVIALAGPLAAQQAAPAEDAPQQRLGDLLKEDGSLNLDSGFRGSIDPSGFKLVSGEGEAPRFEAFPPTPGDEKWQAGFGLSGWGIDGVAVVALALDGAGNLFAGGLFDSAGGVVNTINIARWDGSNWFSLGTGMNDVVLALALDGAGNLIVGGGFTSAGGTPANYIAKWDGSTWFPLGNGMNDSVEALAFDAAGHLYAGGEFTSAGEVADTKHVAKWDGSTWSPVGSGMDDAVFELAFDNAGHLFAGGRFSSASGVADTNTIAMWNGSNWSDVGGGMDDGNVDAMVVDGAGHLFVGGEFTSADGVANTNHIARWDGSNWSALGGGMNEAVNSLILDDDGNLYAGGYFSNAGGVTSTKHIAKWNGSSWSALGSGMDNQVLALAHDGVGNLFVGGFFATAGDKVSYRIGWWSDIPCALRNIAVSDTLLRDTMAEWLGRCVYGPTHTPPSYGGAYTDVADGDYNAGWIQQLFDDTITKGCDDSTIYCPKDTVSKSQAAKLILKAAGETENPPSAPPYADVPVTHPDAGWIDRAKELGVTTGCGDGVNFCPDAVSTQQGFLNMLGGAF